MRVLHILDHSLPIHSGYAFRTAEIIEHQKRMGWVVDALTGPKHDASEESGEAEEYSSYWRAPFPPVYRRLPSLARQVAVISLLSQKIRQLSASQKFDVIHAHSPSLNGLAALNASRSAGIPVVYEMRASWEDAAVNHGTAKNNGFRYRLSRRLESHVLKSAARVTTICDGLRDEICARGVSPAKVTVVPNGVDVERFRATGEPEADLRRRFNASGKYVLVFCGSFYAYEGLDILIDMLGHLGDSRSEFLILLAGGGDQEGALRQRVLDRGLQETVRFLGRVEQSVVIDLYNLADVCVFPRLKMKLTDMVTPLKPLEAMATEGLVLASDVGGHIELIRDQKTGFLFSSGSPENLAKKLLELRSRGACEDIRRRARKFVENERTWRVIVERYSDVYREAASHSTARV